MKLKIRGFVYDDQFREMCVKAAREIGQDKVCEMYFLRQSTLQRWVKNAERNVPLTTPYKEGRLVAELRKENKELKDRLDSIAVLADDTKLPF